jgi:hypothetical protein
LSEEIFSITQDVCSEINLLIKIFSDRIRLLDEDISQENQKRSNSKESSTYDVSELIDDVAHLKKGCDHIEMLEKR